MGNGLIMGSSFELYLDTTGPIVSVLAPDYTMKNSLTDFEVRANERLAIDQGFYFVDSQGEQHEVIFEYNGDSFLGWVDFSQFAEGIAILHVQVKDEVFNLSSEIRHSILIHSGIGVDVELEDMTRYSLLNDSDRVMSSSDNGRKFYEIRFDRVLDAEEEIRSMGVEEDE